MKKVLQTAVLIALCVSVYGQVPHAFNYQAILRNSDGTVKKNELVALKLSIVDDQGTSVYMESHTTSTNALGLLQAVLGQGTSSDDMTTIDWSSGPYFLDISVDGETLGSSPLLSVPYALYAASGVSPWLEQYGTISYTGDFVGIGTESPTEKLEVDGNLKVSGELILDGEGGESEINMTELLELLRGEGILPNNYAGNLTDIDGNVYPTVEIGEQIWMAKNLKVTHYTDGTQISGSGPYWVFNEYDGYYSGYELVKDGGSDTNPSGIQSVCPEGWHLPSAAEWNELLDYLGGPDLAGSKLKEKGLKHWQHANSGESGFSALPKGWYNVEFDAQQIERLGLDAYFWTCTDTDMDNAYVIVISHKDNPVRSFPIYMQIRASVRCVRD